MRFRPVFLAALIFSLVLSACAVYQAQHQPQHQAQPATALSEGPPLSAPADDNLVIRFREQPEAVQQATLLSNLETYKSQLVAQGKYNCCVSPGCNECVIRNGECHCRRVVEKDGPCCGECTQGWIEGRGNVEGVNREEILKHLGCARSLYEKPLPPGETMPGSPTKKQ